MATLALLCDMADGGVLNSRSEVTRSLHSLTVFYPSSSQHLNRTLLKPTTVTVRSVQALKKAIGCCRSWNKKSLFKIRFPVKHYDIFICVCLFQWFGGRSRAEGLGENCVPVYSRSVDVSEFSAEVCWDPSGSWSCWGPEGCCGCSAVTAWPSRSAGAGLHGVSLTTGGLQFSFQLISFVALTFQI